MTSHPAPHAARDHYADTLDRLVDVAGRRAAALRTQDPTDPDGGRPHVPGLVATCAANADRARVEYADARELLIRGAAPDAAADPSEALPPATAGERPRRFQLLREVDPSGLSGTGVIACGVAWPDGLLVLRWRAVRLGVAQVEMFTGGETELLLVHGHDGSTRVVWTDQ